MIDKMLQAPFPYFGGKSRIASVVWNALGDVKHYIEPFFGSGAVLLARPNYDASRHIETICDKNGFVCNAWRAIKAEPEKLAELCDWPVNHADLMARKRALLIRNQTLLNQLVANDKWYDLELAAYWIWARSCSIGEGEHALNQRPAIAGGGKGIHKLSMRKKLVGWFEALSARLRYVRVVCGDWKRVCGGNWQDDLGTVGIFFDPPYSHTIGRDNMLYQVEDADASHEVEQWALERGARPLYRIVVAGYEGEHPELEAAGWQFLKWRAQGGYSRTRKKGKNLNRFRERLWLSPHCVDAKINVELELFRRAEEA
jgi:DNA adenine methylase